MTQRHLWALAPIVLAGVGAGAAEPIVLDRGEPCAVLRAQAFSGTFTTMKALPPRCVPASERVEHVYQLPGPKGAACLPRYAYDKHGHAGHQCGPVVLVFKRTSDDEDCADDVGEFSQAYRSAACVGAGTGLLICDDGHVAVSMSAVAKHCEVVVQEHVPPIEVPRSER